MHQTTLLRTFALILLFMASQSAQAQYRRVREREKEEKKEDNKLASKIWYGGGVNIGFGGFNGTSTFALGLSPMVGYRVVGPLSVGPRFAFDFISYKRRGFPSENLTSYDLGVFARVRVFQGLFLQGEVSNQWYQDLDPLAFVKFNDQRVNRRLGAGWNFGQPGGAGSEISVLYNFSLANEINTWQNPIEYRFGFTWKF
jgi:hypothetical protein